MSHPQEAFTARRTSRFRRLFILLGILLFALLAFRLYLPALVKHYVNRELDHVGDYHGHIDSVRIQLWRSAYSIRGLSIVKSNGEVPIPFFNAPIIDFSLHWGALFRGQLVGKLAIEHPQLNFVEADTPDKKQTSMDANWQDQLKQLFPLRISRMSIHEGEIHFRNFQSKPGIDLYLHHLNALATNLTNSKKLSKTLKATLDANGIAMSGGRFQTHWVLDPLVEKPTFKVSFQLEHLELRELNNFFKHYLAVEVKDGNLSYYMEGTADQGQFEGYAKPLIDHLNFIRIKEDPTLAETAKAIVVKFVSYVMKNHVKDRLATRIEISGTVENPQANTWSAIAHFLGNWLIRAISPGLEGSPKDVKQT